MTILPSSTGIAEVLANVHVMRTRLAEIIIDSGNRGMDAMVTRYSDFDEVFAECEIALRSVAQAGARPFAWALTWPDGEVSFTRREPDAAASLLVTPLFAGAAQAAPEPTIDQFGGLIEHYLRYTISTKEGRFTARNLLNQFEIRPRAGAHSSTNSGDAT